MFVLENVLTDVDLVGILAILQRKSSESCHINLRHSGFSDTK